MIKKIGMILLVLMMTVSFAYADDNTNANNGSSNGEVYKSTDANGATSFSDKPTPGAEKVEVAPVQTFSAPAVSNTSGSAQSTQPAVADTSYQSLTIVSPQVDQYPPGAVIPVGPQGATVWSNDGTLTVGVVVDPALHPGDTLQLLVNGAVAQESQDATSFNLTGLTPNQYTLTAQVVDANKQMKISSDPLVVFIRHHTQNN